MDFPGWSETKSPNECLTFVADGNAALRGPTRIGTWAAQFPDSRSISKARKRSASMCTAT
jgi:hypothetical protein